MQNSIDPKKIEKLRSCVNLIKKSFECTICIDFFDDPVITNCQHTFCKKCIENYIGSKRTQSCPLCKNTINLRSLKKFSSLNHYVTSTKKLEDAFQRDLNPKSNKPDQPEDKSSTDSSVSHKRKRRTISSEDINLNKKKKSEDIATSSSVITSTRDDQIDKPYVENSIEQTVIEDRSNQANCSKVKDWLEKNLENLDDNSNDGQIEQQNVVRPQLQPQPQQEPYFAKPSALADSTNKINGNVFTNTRSSITITRLKSAKLIINQIDKEIGPDQGDKLVNNEENEPKIPILTIGDFSTNPCSSKEMFVINEADVNLNFNNDKQTKSPGAQRGKSNNGNETSDLSKIDSPLKFTKDANINATTVHNSTTKSSTTPKLNRTSANRKQTPKSKASTIDSKRTNVQVENTINYQNENQPLIIQDTYVEPVSNINKGNSPTIELNNTRTKKSVKFLNLTQISRPIFKRSKSESDLKRKISSSACESCLSYSNRNKNKNTNKNPEKSTESISTNTDLVINQDSCIQVDKFDLLLNHFDYENFELNLITEIYDLEESSLLSEILSDFFKSIRSEKTAFVYSVVQSIPDSPPLVCNPQIPESNPPVTPQVQLQIDDSLIQPLCDDRHETSVIAPNKSALFIKENFSDLLNTSSSLTNKKTSRKEILNFYQKKKPSLEFLSKTPSFFLNNSINLNESVAAKKLNHQNQNLETSIIEDTNPRDHRNQNTIDDTIQLGAGDETAGRSETIEESLIIEDTPVKSDNELSTREDLRELNETLSKSASRLEHVNARILFENSIIRYENSFNTTLNRSNDALKNHKSRPGEVDKTIIFEPKNKSTDPAPEPESVQYQDQIQNLIITDTVQMPDFERQTTIQPSDKEHQQNTDSTLILANNNNNTSLNETVDFNQTKPAKTPLKKVPPAHENQCDNHSFFLNSLNMTTNLNANSVPPLLSLSNTSFNDKTMHVDKLPPAARDILGVSLANESTYSLANTFIEPSLSSNKKKSSNRSGSEHSILSTGNKESPKTSREIQTSVVLDSKLTANRKKNEEESQLLTDSACFMIENICKDFYSIQNQTICEEPDERPKKRSTTSSSNTGHSTSSNRRFEFVYSLLSHEMKLIIGKYAQNNNIGVANDLTESTTHLIVDSDKNLLCGVTCKYLKAISRKIWIVSIAWILNCINTGQFLKPDKFEIKGDKSFGIHNGPMLSRLSTKHLYESYEFLFIGEFLSADSVSLEDITQLVVLNRGVVRRKAKDFTQDDQTKKKIVIFDEKAKKISLTIAKSLKSNEIDCVNKSWLIDSLACFKLREMNDYQTYDETQ